MAAESWTCEEQARLRSLRLDPMRNDRHKLLAIKAHFDRKGTVYAISEGQKVEPNVSGELARKLRDLTRQGKLDWLVSGLPCQGSPARPSAGSQEHVATKTQFDSGAHRNNLLGMLGHTKSIGRLRKTEWKGETPAS